MTLLKSFVRSFILPLLLSTWTNGNLIERQSNATGDSHCGRTMCIAATLNGSTIEYVLESTGKRNLGWMAIGYGHKMAQSPMIIMWPNSDGSVTLSQRKSSGHQQPTVDSNPPRTAAILSSVTTASGSTPKLAFTIPADSDLQPYIIYAFGDTNPGSSAVDADLEQHYEDGQTQLDLTKTLSSSTTTGSGTGTSSSGSNSSSSNSPLLGYQRMIIAHAVFCAVGFLLLLPGGALLARYLRTYVPGPFWFRGHWIAQLGLAGPVIVVGIALGIISVTNSGSSHLDDGHKKLGAGIFVLYGIQCALGAFIHFVKRPGATRRPAQNYFHGVLGLFIIALAMFQVHDGCEDEWTMATGRDPLPNGVFVFFIIWVVIISILYFAGLALLPRQYKQEKLRRQLGTKYNGTTEALAQADHYDMQDYRDRS